MNIPKIVPHLFSILALLILQVVISAGPAHAQESAVTPDLVLTEQLNNAQVLSLSNLGVSRSGGGATLFTLSLQNNSSSVQEQLYLDIEIASNNVGTIAEVYSLTSTPFRLDAGERIVATNNQLQDGLPGIEEFIDYDGRITNAGRDFLNDLEGSTRLPSDIYTVTLSVYQGANRMNGGTQVASITQEFGLNITSETSIDLYLLQPGGALGSGRSINNEYPVFWWSGPTNLNYRLVVVRNDGSGSAEELLQSATNTPPTNSGSGSLLSSEIIDVSLTNTTYSMPASGVEQLTDGETYYWQVFTSRQGVSSSETTSSEIYEFTYVSPNSTSGQPGVTGTSYAQEEKELIRSALNRILGGERLQSLMRQGMDFNSMVIDGVSYQGKAALQKLQELRTKIENGEITLVRN